MRQVKVHMDDALYDCMNEVLYTDETISSFMRAAIRREYTYRTLIKEMIAEAQQVIVIGNQHIPIIQNETNKAS